MAKRKAKKKSRAKKKKSKKKTKRVAIKKPKAKKEKPKAAIEASISVESPEFIKLQNEWYSKLKDAEFEDIEWLDKKTGKGQDNPYMKRSVSNIRQMYNPDVENHFRLCRNYLTHGKFNSDKERFIFAHYIEGESYRKIIEELGASSYEAVSIYTICQIIKRLKESMMEFNREDPEGMLNENNQDLILDDFSIVKE